MARLEAKPWPGFDLSGGGDIHAAIKKQEELLREIEKKHTVVQFPVADGYALYAVTSEKPLTLRHIPFGDGYQAAAATIRGLTIADVRHQEAYRQAMQGMAKQNEDWYESLKVGSFVHYDHGFGEYVRCEVVLDKDGKRELLPVALVGTWRSHDLPRRMPDGSIHWGYHAEQIRRRDTMCPHSSNIWECPKYARRGNADPSGLPALDLSIPEMGAKEAERAKLWRKVDAIRETLNVIKPSTDPAEVLERVRALVAA